MEGEAEVEAEAVEGERVAGSEAGGQSGPLGKRRRRERRRGPDPTSSAKGKEPAVAAASNNKESGSSSSSELVQAPKSKKTLIACDFCRSEWSAFLLLLSRLRLRLPSIRLRCEAGWVGGWLGRAAGLSAKPARQLGSRLLLGWTARKIGGKAGRQAVSEPSLEDAR